ncbi:MAG: asparagine synthase (glutamine-hydrolyzing) [Acidobacteria bacterium]|nr:asparagine synthase (glutamine-hydrolyzing) [Acidobacteriota bacterium]
MCGIIGSISIPELRDDVARVRSGMARMRHRGPDDEGLTTEALAGGAVVLGHTRLSIIDLSPGGHQPMDSPDGRFTIVFNGEIYNYRELRELLASRGHSFRTDSDTEVLLACWAEWGSECLTQLRGMFAFAVLDRAEVTLTCVRDAFGIKPFIYCVDRASFRFASEMRALLALLPTRPGLDVERAHDYLVLGTYDDQAATFYANVHHLLPGHFLVVHLVDALRTEVRRWWHPSLDERSEQNFDQAAEEVRSMFLQNIRLHLRSDVPLGAALSGGIDSSAVVCAMRHLEPDIPIHTFSFVARGSEVDEERWADIVNAHVGAIPHKVVVSPEELPGDLDDMIRVQGEPFGSTSVYAGYRLYRLAKEHGITVTLDGQGADELLAGYNGYPHAYLHSLLERREYLESFRFLNAWSKGPGRSRAQIWRMLGSHLTPSMLKTGTRRMRRAAARPAWINADGLEGAFHSPFEEQTVDLPIRGRRLVRALRSALTGKGLCALLRHGDRNSMRWSVESRVPFLTTDFAEYLLRLPESYLLSPRGETKRVFRAAMRGIVPDVILDRRDKIGFQTPERVWLAGQHDRIEQWLEPAKSVPFLNFGACVKEVDASLNGSRRFGYQAWRLINYSRWLALQE